MRQLFFFFPSLPFLLGPLGIIPALSSVVTTLLQSHGTMKHYLLAVLLLSGVFSALCLSSGEIEALQDLLHNIPELGHLAVPWTTNVSAACDYPTFQGVACIYGSETHVIGLYGQVLLISQELLAFNLLFAHCVLQVDVLPSSTDFFLFFESSLK